MNSWIQELAVLLAAEFHGRKTLGTLCTVDQNDEPRARMVVVCRVNELEGTITLATDARSRKATQIKSHPVAELVFWSGSERQQFRLHGSVEFVRSGPDRLDCWRQSSDATRAMYFWPPPGEPYEAGESFAAGIPAGMSVPENFVLIELRPTEVESLELNEHPHCRRRWREASGWVIEPLNP